MGFHIFNVFGTGTYYLALNHHRSFGLFFGCSSGDPELGTRRLRFDSESRVQLVCSCRVGRLFLWGAGTGILTHQSSPPPAGPQSGGNGNAGQGSTNNGASAAGGGYGSSDGTAANDNDNASSGSGGGYGSTGGSGEVLTQNPTAPPTTNNSAYGNENAGVGDDDSQAGHANNNNSDSKTCGRKSKRAAASKKRGFHRGRYDFESNQFQTRLPHFLVLFMGAQSFVPLPSSRSNTSHSF
ncbi:hypothetical protein PM082_015678 [Marasmius tenuissimus]|nr:hypothetical protein PM082_015678 [Marasmius tenuissimus]